MSITREIPLGLKVTDDGALITMNVNMTGSFDANGNLQTKVSGSTFDGTSRLLVNTMPVSSSGGGFINPTGNVWASGSLTIGTAITGSTVYTDGCRKFVAQFKFSAGAAGKGVTGSFGWQGTSNGIDYYNLFSEGLNPSMFRIISGSKIDGVDQSIGGDNCTLIQQIERPAIDLRPVFLPISPCQGSLLGGYKKW